MFMFGFLHWNPAKEILVLPLVNWPILWYGFFFGFGFFIGYLIFLKRIKNWLTQKALFIQEDITDERKLLLFLQSRFTKEELGKKKNSLDMLNYLLQKKDLSSLSLFQGKNSFLSNRELLESFLSSYIQPLSKKAARFTDKLLLYVILGTVIGAKLGHFLFYENYLFYLQNPLELFHGRGFASHGAVIGVCIAGYLFTKKTALFSWKSLLDFMALPSLFIAGCIRLGNFFNQEVLGKATNVFWAVVFENPLDGSFPCPRHPAQLYESFFYFLLFALFYFVTKKEHKTGKVAGALLVSLFSFRIFIEFFKEEQSSLMSGFFNMGQLLSLPILFLGLWLFFSGRKNSTRKKVSQTEEQASFSE